jgi:hypothetical protein
MSQVKNGDKNGEGHFSFTLSLDPLPSRERDYSEMGPSPFLEIGPSLFSPLPWWERMKERGR